MSFESNLSHGLDPVAESLFTAPQGAGIVERVRGLDMTCLNHLGPPPHPASAPRLALGNQFNSALARLRALRRMLPADFPDWRTCYKYFRQWS